MHTHNLKKMVFLRKDFMKQSWLNTDFLGAGKTKLFIKSTIESKVESLSVNHLNVLTLFQS